MAFTEKELEFLEENRSLIEKGSPALKEVADKVMDISAGEDVTKSKLIFAIVYSIQGADGFSARVSAEYKSPKVEGALLNRTAAKASGVALQPSMYKAKTKIVYYKIENNKIVSEKKASLVDLATYKNELSQGGYNLVILDTPGNVDSVKAAFSGNILFTVRFLANVVVDRGVIRTVTVENVDPLEAKKLAKTRLIEGISKSCDGMVSAITSVVNQVIDKTDFKV